jgi:hypothetical protein
MYPNVGFKLSTVVSDHGTTDSRHNVPSNFKGALTAGFVVELSYVLNGYILMAPDYVGMGTGEGTSLCGLCHRSRSYYRFYHGSQ